MKYFFDCEFHENGSTIDLISIGIVCENDKEFYAVSSDFDKNAAEQNEWLKANVLSLLPPPGDPVYKTRKEIKEGILEFIGHDKHPEFYAWYGAYDWVALCQLFGKMIDLPPHFPMYVRDLKYVADMLGVNNDLPPQDGTEHSAIEDARWNVIVYHFLSHLPKHPV